MPGDLDFGFGFRMRNVIIAIFLGLAIILTGVAVYSYYQNQKDYEFINDLSLLVNEWKKQDEKITLIANFLVKELETVKSGEKHDKLLEISSLGYLADQQWRQSKLALLAALDSYDDKKLELARELVKNTGAIIKEAENKIEEYKKTAEN
jgi:hypothetical protein